jgi:hypothetical protein
MRKPLFALLLAGVLCAAGWLTTAAAQDTTAPSQEPSVAEAARKARAEKKKEPAAKHVWTDDNLPKTPHEEPAAAGEGEAAAEAGAGEKAAEKPAGGGADEEKKKAELEAKWRQRFADAHKKLDDDQKDLDLMQREYNLKREQYYSDPNTAMREQYNRYGGGRGPELDALQKKMEERKQDIEKDKQAISDLEDELRKAGLPPGWSRP